MVRTSEAFTLHLLDRLKSDKYGNWTKVFTPDQLEEVVRRFAEEANLFDWTAPVEEEDELVKLQDELDTLTDQIFTVGITWDRDARTIRMQEPVASLRP